MHYSTHIELTRDFIYNFNYVLYCKIVFSFVVVFVVPAPPCLGVLSLCGGYKLH